MSNASIALIIALILALPFTANSDLQDIDIITERKDGTNAPPPT